MIRPDIGTSNERTKKGGPSMEKRDLLALVGFILGLPLSYFFQSDFIRSKFSIGEYIGAFPRLLTSGDSNLIIPIAISCVICAVMLGIVGHFMDLAEKKN